ncbi:MAG: hypothetical protein V2I33_24845, partial [Kangiellaceae bacterium]|nr:hypothetical protein [Kangiellaceae bacterium]
MLRDHHCDYTNQCVGPNNYKSFISFASSVPLGVIHFELRALQYLWHWYYADLKSVQDVEWEFLALLLIHMYLGFGFFMFTLDLAQS